MIAPTLGSYTLIKELGQGGVGRVYEAHDPRTGRRVALKMLRREHTGLASQRVLLDEAAIVAQLSHPNVVELIDVGRDETGALFLVMELVEGFSLRSWELHWPGARALFRAYDEILGALSTAHAQGIVHGDLKPNNVLLDAHGRVKITDFGIARVLDPLRASKDRGLAGTPRYMAPEQLFERDEIGPWTDLYAVGVMLREVLGANSASERETLAEMLARKRRPQTPFFPRRGLQLPAQLVELLDRLVHPDPRRRSRFAARVKSELGMLARRVNEDAVIPGLIEEDEQTLIEDPRGTTMASARGVTPDRLPLFDEVATTTASHMTVRRLRAVPLVDRAEQIARLLSLAREAAEGGGPRALLIVGRAGEGKSRIARHGFAVVESDGSMLGAAASYEQSQSSGSVHVDLRACLRRLLGTPRRGSSLVETLADRWAWCADGFTTTSDVDPEAIHAWLHPDAGPVEAEQATALARGALCAASRTCPLYLWLDDVGWSHDGALRLVHELLETDARIFVVATMRTGTVDHPSLREWYDRIGTHPRATVALLPPFGPRERAELMATLGVEPRTATELGDALDGPTLVLVEAVRDWMDQGLLIDSDDGHVVAAGVSPATLAARTRGIIARRLDTLLSSFGDGAPDAERVLVHAALLGEYFEERALRACCDVDVDGVLDRALLVGWLRVQRPGVYRFEHQLFAEALAERARTRADAAAIYRQTGRAILDLYGINTETTLRAAEFFRRSSDREASVTTAVDAAGALSRAHVMDRAADVLRMLDAWLVEDGTPNDHPHRGHYLRARGRWHYFALRFSEARADYERARRIFAKNGLDVAAQWTTLSIASAYLYDERFRTCERLIEGVMADQTIGPGVRARGRHELATLAALRGELATAIEYEQEALDCTLSSPDGRPTAHVYAATLTELFAAAGEPEKADETLARFRELVHGSPDPFVALDLARAAAAIEVTQGHWHAAREMIEPRLASMSSRGNRWYVTADRALLAVVAAAVASPSVAERAARAFMTAYATVKHDEPMTWWCIRATAALLQARQMSSLADAVARVLDERLVQLKTAFAASR